MRGILALSLLFAFAQFPVDAQEVSDKGKEPYSLEEDEEKLLNQTTVSTKVNDLREIYRNKAVNESVTFDRSYMIEEPLGMVEVVNFEHPYLNIMVSDLTESDRDAIMKSVQEEKSKQNRYKSIMMTAMKFATDSALYKKTRSFHEKLRKDYYHEMTQIFPFHALTLENGKIRPPVINEIGFSREIESKRKRREFKKRYRIEKQAEVINEPQTYMDFFGNLLTEKPEPPNVYLLPLNDEELYYWRKGTLNGWVAGNRLANEIIRADIRSALAEFSGQLRFHYLAQAKIISMPTSQNINVGTNSNGLAVNIGESVFEITDLPRFNDNEMEWIALPQVDDIFEKLTQDDVDELSIYLDHEGNLK